MIFRPPLLLAVATVAALAAGLPVPAVAAPPTAASAAAEPGATPPAVLRKKVMKMKKRLRMDEPMTSQMSQQGMMKKDVQAGRETKEREMKEMMEQEQRDVAAPAGARAE